MAKLSPESLLRQAVDAVNICIKEGMYLDGTPSAIRAAARRLGLPPSTLHSRLDSAKRRLGLVPDVSLEREEDDPFQDALQRIDLLESDNKKLRLMIQQTKREDITRESIRLEIFDLKDYKPHPPKWLKSPSTHVTGTPTLFLSDWHWGEVVNSSEVDGANEYDLDIARQRVEKLVHLTETLLYQFSRPEYPGIVICLGGDMITGDIHEELGRTNETPTIPAALDLYDTLIGMFDRMLKTFKNVFVPCVTGNHGRNTKKIQCKERWATSYEWLIYSLLERHYKEEPRIKFLVPHSADCSYQIYSHRYKLTHGDQFRGGDGMIGPLGPITRGRHKKASRDASIDRSFHTLLLGHFHTLLQLPHMIVNGSLVGYNEFAYANNMPYERPSQALWITHPENGITVQMPLYLDEPQKHESESWVSWNDVPD